MRFLVDAQLPPALARRLTALGHVAEHVSDAALTSAPDSAIDDYATRAGAVIITKDEDFAPATVVRRTPVVWLRLGKQGEREQRRQLREVLKRDYDPSDWRYGKNLHMHRDRLRGEPGGEPQVRLRRGSW